MSVEVTEREALEAVDSASRMWWVFLVTGVAWVVISFMVLALNPTTPATIGYLAGFVLIAAGVNELMMIGFAENWRWVHGVMGALFLIAGIMALLEPFQTFGILALLVGWYLLFKGTFMIILSLVERHRMPLWGLALAIGFIDLSIGVWAIGYPGRSAYLLVLWVGIGALMRGISEIVTAFQLRRVRHAAA